VLISYFSFALWSGSYDSWQFVHAHPGAAVSAAGGGAAAATAAGPGAATAVSASAGASGSVSSTRMRNGNVVEGITDAFARSSKKIFNAGTDNVLTGTDGIAKIYKDTVARPITTAGVAMQNMATSLSNANKVFADGIRAGVDDAVSRPMASIAGTYENLIASGGASSGAFFDNAFTKPLSLFGAATRDLLSSSFPGEASETTATVGDAAATSTATTSSSSTSSSVATSTAAGQGASAATGAAGRR